MPSAITRSRFGNLNILYNKHSLVVATVDKYIWKVFMKVVSI